jgi:hypothetical protein
LLRNAEFCLFCSERRDEKVTSSTPTTYVENAKRFAVRGAQNSASRAWRAICSRSARYEVQPGRNSDRTAIMRPSMRFPTFQEQYSPNGAQLLHWYNSANSIDDRLIRSSHIAVDFNSATGG